MEDILMKALFLILAAILALASVLGAQQFELTNNFLQNLSFVTGTDRGREQNLDDNFAWMQQQGYTHLRFFGILPNGYYTFPSPTLEANGYPTNSFFTSVLELLVQKANQYGITVNFDGWEVIAESNYDTTKLGVGYITEEELGAIVQDVLSLGVELISEEQFGGGYIQTIQATTSQAGATHETTTILWWQYDWASLIADCQLGNAFSFYPFDQAEFDSVLGISGSQSYPANIGLLHVIMESARHYNIPRSIAAGSFGTFESHNWKNVLRFTQMVHTPDRFSIEESDTYLLIWDPGFNFMEYIGNDVVSLADQAITDRPIANLVYDLSALYDGALYPTWYASIVNAAAIVNTFTSMGYKVVASVDSLLPEAEVYYVLLAGGAGYPEVAALPDYVMPLLEGSKTVFVQPTYGIPDDNDDATWIPLRELFGLPAGNTPTAVNSIPETVLYNGQSVRWGGIWLYLTPLIEEMTVDQVNTENVEVALSAAIGQEDIALILKNENKYLINSNLIHLGAYYILSDLLGGPLKAPSLTDVIITEDKALFFAEHETSIDVDLGWNSRAHLVHYDSYGDIITDADTAIYQNFAAQLSQGDLLIVYKGENIFCGDANSDQAVNVGDAVFLINYIFRSGSAPDPLSLGDANCDSEVNVGDAVYLIAYIFKGGPEPCCP